MVMKRLLLLLLAQISITFSISSQQFYFKKYQVEDGLSHNTVWTILQDSYGFIWFGTGNGINRFDGQRFKVFKSDIKDKYSLGNNSVQTLFEDENKNIWIGTTNGIFIFDHIKGIFTPFDRKTQFGVSISSEVKKIIKSKKGKIWIGTLGQGFFIYDPEAKSLVQNSTHTPFVWDIEEDITNRIYISSLKEGLICFDQNGKYIESYTSFLDTGNKRSSKKINCIKSINEKIWFAVGMNNLSCLDGRTREIETINCENINIGTIKCLSKYSDREIMVGSDNGLYLFNTLTKEFLRINSLAPGRGLSNQSINCILKDKEGGVWISTYLGGVNYLAQQTKNFEYYYPVYTPSQTIIKIINQFCEDKERNIWIGSQSELSVLNYKTQKLEVFTPPKNSLKYDICALMLDDDDLWVGTMGGGIQVINLKTKKVKEYRHQQEVPNTICSNDIMSLHKGKNGDIYVGTAWGLCTYNRDKDNFSISNFIGSMVTVLDILEDQRGFLWIATLNSGVFRCNLQDKEWIHYLYEEDAQHSINSKTIISLFEDSHGTVWFGTDGGGLFFHKREGDSDIFIDFDPEDKVLPNKVIYSMEEDNAGNLWISTNSGLLRIHPENKKNYKHFTQENGLQGNQFNARASLKTDNGKLYFGGINGFNAFYPDEFRDNMYVPPVYIVGMKLYDRNNGINGVSMHEEIPIYLKDKTILPFNRNNFTLEFAALSYEDNKRNLFCYKLEGFDTDWVYTYSNSAVYTNLSPGEYVFRVKAANNDGIRNEEGAYLKIHITPPLWQSAYAYLAYILLFALCSLLVARIIIKKTNKKIQEKIDVFNTQKEKEVYQSKINFFVNLVHEIRTPLSLIKLPLEKMSENGNESTNNYLPIINKNIDYLLNVVNQLLDFQKTENNEIKLNLKLWNVNELMREMYDQFVHYAGLNSIKLNFQGPDEEREVRLDKEVVSKIVVNLLSNAMKYAKSRIDLRLEYTDESLEVSVIDDGPGVPDNEKEKIFEAFYQANTTRDSGTGIGLAYSRLLAEGHNGTLLLSDNEGGGSVFKLIIPAHMAASEEVAAEQEIGNTIIDINEAGTEADTQNFKSCRILLVEDNRELLNLVSDLLKNYFTIIKASDGRQALEKLTGDAIDIVVCDVMMPVMDGFELCSRIKSDINISHIPVILLTAKANMESKIEGLGYGADVYIEKPFSIKYLRMQIENLLKLRLSFQKLMLTMPALAKTEATSNKDKDFLSKLQIEIDKHLSDPDFPIDILADKMYMSRSNFYRKIKTISGMPPNDYLKVIRLNKAAELLGNRNIRINEISGMVGFNSPSYFAKCFKTQFGTSPKDYAEKQK